MTNKKKQLIITSLICVLSLIIGVFSTVLNNYDKINDLYSAKYFDIKKDVYFKGEIDYVFDAFAERISGNDLKSDYYLVALDSYGFVMVEFTGNNIEKAANLLEYILYIEGYISETEFSDHDSVKFEYEGFFKPVSDELLGLYYEYFIDEDVSKNELDSLLIPYVLSDDYMPSNHVLSSWCFTISAITGICFVLVYFNKDNTKNEDKIVAVITE